MNAQPETRNPFPTLGNASIPAAIASVQLLIIPGAVLGSFLIRLHADFTQEQLNAVGSTMFFSVFFGTLIAAGLGWSLTANARRRLEAMQSGDSRPQAQAELVAWREISAFSWRYGVFVALIGFVVTVLPGAVLPYSSGAINNDQYLFILAGGGAAVLIVSVFSTVLLERLLTQKRLMLLPARLEPKLAGRAGLNVSTKFQVLALALCTISILVIAPAGYHHMLMAMHPMAGSPAADYQLQSLLLAAALLLLAFGLAYSTSRPVSDFLSEMSRALLAIETGDFSQRASISTTDETADLAVHFNNVLDRLDALQGKLEDEVKMRAQQLEAIFEVGQAALQIQDLGQLVEKVVSQIGERFGYYFAAIYLLDQSERWAELKGATGAAGQVLLANKHRIDLSDRSLIAMAVSSRQVQNALQATDPQTQNPLLPYTRSELALPLVIGDRIFGVLDVHASEEDAFGQQEMQTLQNMANQVATALENSRLYREAQQSVLEMKASQKNYLKTSWDALTAESPNLGYSIGDDDTEGGHDIRVPLTLREQIIGEISLTGGLTDWSTEERGIIEAVAAQAALALENARLVEESQAAAARDHLLADITAKVWSATSIDGILQTAIRELGRALETDEAAIELKVE